MEDGCLGWPGVSTVTSQPLDSKNTPMVSSPSNPGISPHTETARHPSHCVNNVKREQEGEERDRKEGKERC